MIAVVAEKRDRSRLPVAAAFDHVEGGLPVEWLTTAEADVLSDELLGRYSGFFLASGVYERPDAAVRVVRLARERGVPLVGT